MQLFVVARYCVDPGARGDGDVVVVARRGGYLVGFPLVERILPK